MNDAAQLLKDILGRMVKCRIESDEWRQKHAAWSIGFSPVSCQPRPEKEWVNGLAVGAYGRQDEIADVLLLCDNCQFVLVYSVMGNGDVACFVKSTWRLDCASLQQRYNGGPRTSEQSKDSAIFTIDREYMNGCRSPFTELCNDFHLNYEI